MFSSVSVINSLARWCDPFTVTGQHSCAYTLPLKVFSVYICLYVCVSQCVTGCAYPWLLSLCLPLSLRPNGGCQTIELELCPRVSLLANTSLTSCHRKTARELQKSCSTEHWGEKISGGAAIWSAPMHHRLTRLCIITTRLGAQLRLWAKMGAGKVLWDSNNCTSRYSNCSYNQTPNSQTLLWINWLKNMAGCPKWEAKHPCRAETMDGGTKSEWELLRRPEEKGCGDHVVLHGLWISIQFRKLKSDSSLACYSV